MSKASELKARLIKIIYDEWFKIIVGGVIIAVISFYLPYIFGDQGGGSIKPIPQSGLLLDETYMIKPNKSYSIDEVDLDNGTVISYNWRDVAHTTRDSETNQIITISREVVSATMAINSGQTFNGVVSQGRPFNAGNCDVGGLIMHLMDKPIRASDTLKIRLVKKSC